MTLPASGQLSISDIMSELSSSNGSLAALGALAGFSGEIAISDFYGYTYHTMSISPLSFDVYNQSGTNTTYYAYTIDGTEAWYAVVDNSEIPFLTWSPMSDADGYYYPGHFTSSVTANGEGYWLSGWVTFYWTKDDNYAGAIYCIQEN